MSYDTVFYKRFWCQKPGALRSRSLENPDHTKREPIGYITSYRFPFSFIFQFFIPGQNPSCRWPKAQHPLVPLKPPPNSFLTANDWITLSKGYGDCSTHKLLPLHRHRKWQSKLPASPPASMLSTGFPVSSAKIPTQYNVQAAWDAL